MTPISIVPITDIASPFDLAQVLSSTVARGAARARYVQEATMSAAIPLRYRRGTVQGATDAAPIVITSNSHGLLTGDKVVVASVGGNTAANGTWIVTGIDGDTFSLDDSDGNSAWTSGGTWYQLAPQGITKVALQAETQNIRFRCDGVSPDASTGMLLIAGGEPTIFDSGSLTKMLLIEAAGGAKLNITFYP